MKQIISVAALLGLAAAQVNTISIDPSTRQIRDSFGRSVIFHGVNVVYKVAPYIPQDNAFDADLSLTDAEIDQLKSWGFNFVRLGVMWEAVETAPGQYNDTYLDRVEELINKLGQRGIYSLVDAHQDVLARSICGEGMPNFYANYSEMPHECHPGILPYMFPYFNFCIPMDSYNFTKDENGNPLIEDC
jgi:endoglycosylceramidase